MRENSSYKPDRYVEDVPLDRVRNEEFDLIVIEVGANQDSNLDLRKKLKPARHREKKLIEITNTCSKHPVFLSRPDKSGCARISGHLGSIARITPGFL